MDYRRKSLLRSKQTAPSPENRLDRVVAISSIVSNIVIGVATVVLAGIGLYLTSEFNQWQVANAERQAASAKVKGDLETLQRTTDSCFAAANAVVGMIKGLSENEARNILQKTDTATSTCPNIGLNIPDLAAIFILKNQKNINPSIIKMAAKRVNFFSKISNIELRTAILHSTMKEFLLQQRRAIVNAREIETESLIAEKFEAAGPKYDKECIAKFDAEVKAKPNDPAWSVECDDGSTISRIAI
jgi:hypothetical protein